MPTTLTRPGSGRRARRKPRLTVHPWLGDDHREALNPAVI